MRTSADGTVVLVPSTVPPLSDRQLDAYRTRLGLEGGRRYALFFLLSPAITTLPMMPKALGGWRWKRSQRVGYLSLALVVVHLVVLGYKGWLTPAKWPSTLQDVSTA